LPTLFNVLYRTVFIVFTLKAETNNVSPHFLFLRQKILMMSGQAVCITFRDGHQLTIGGLGNRINNWDCLFSPFPSLPNPVSFRLFSALLWIASQSE
jgi:hypothetical protein